MLTIQVYFLLVRTGFSVKLVFVSHASRNAFGNAPLHTAFLVSRSLADSKVPKIPQPPYSPGVAPSEVFWFPRLKTHMKGHHFETVDIVKEACTKALKDIPEKAYRDAFDAWKTR